MKISVRILSTVTVLMLTAFAIVTYSINTSMVDRSRTQIRSTPAHCERVQAAVLLGAGVYANKRVSAIVYDRIVTAVEIYKAGKAEKILVTGDHGKKYYDEVNTILHWLRKFDVPEEDIFTDYAGFSTYDSIVRAREIFGVETAILVTQEFHLPRALFIARNHGIKVQGYRADRQRYIYIKRYMLREYMARIKDFLYVRIFRPNPRFLGEKIPITGDGRVSRDHTTRR